MARVIRASSLRARLLLLLVLVGAPALGIVLYTGLQQRRQAAAEAHREAAGLARSVAAGQQRLTTETRQLLSLLARLEPVRDPERCGPFLADLLADDERFANLGVIRPDGELVCSALPLPGRLNLADRAYFRRALATGDFAVGDYQIGRVTGEASVNFATPLLDAGGAVRGVVYAALPLSWLHARLAEGRLPRESSVTVVDPSFSVLARFPEPEGWTGRSIAGSALAAAIRGTGGQGTAETAGPDGVERLYAFTPLQELPGARPAYVIVGIPSRVAYGAVDRGLLRNAGTLALLGLLVLSAAWWGSEAFVLRPVRSLLGATRRLAAGELDARAPVVEGGGELSELGRSFNGMAAVLQERDREIQAHLVRIARQNRMYAVLSGIGSALLRVRRRRELLDELCRIAVEEGKLEMAMVHRVDPADGCVELAARAVEAEAEAGEPLACGDGTGARAWVEAVLREEREIVSSDAGADPRLDAWRPRVGAGGLRSAAAAPLRVDGAVFGVLTLVSDEPGFFDAEEEQRLLRDLAADTSLGLQYLENERRLQHVSHHDAITDLPNRTLFEDRLQQAVARASQNAHSAAVMVVGVDRLAQTNATLGHHAGDEVLRGVADYLAGAVRAGDTVARLGSDEFGIVLGEVEDAEAVATLANEILEGAPRRFAAAEEEIFVSLSMGVAIYPLDGKEGPELVKNAALARQTAPSEVANTLVFHSSEINARARGKRRIEHELRGALAAEELRLLYQPVVDVATRTVVGVESLVRWQSDELGAVPPGTFIPVAEETGLITPIGEWIVATACLQGRRWNRRGFGELRINVNVSVDQLREGDFVERVRAILRETGFDPSRLALGLEITESALMENLQEAVDAVLRFKEMGLAVYIDDFGTGYSSLAYLRQLPIDTLKIDTSFVRDIPESADAVAVVKGIVAMAHSLELRVIAEGVETEAQFAVLRRLGCDAVQGYLFGKPAPPEEVETLFGRAL